VTEPRRRTSWRQPQVFPVRELKPRQRWLPEQWLTGRKVVVDAMSGIGKSRFIIDRVYIYIYFTIERPNMYVRIRKVRRICGMRREWSDERMSNILLSWLKTRCGLLAVAMATIHVQLIRRDMVVSSQHGKNVWTRLSGKNGKYLHGQRNFRGIDLSRLPDTGEKWWMLNIRVTVIRVTAL